MKCRAACFTAWAVVLNAVTLTAADNEAGSPPAYTCEGWSTVGMGGVDVSPEQLRAMQEGDYLLHAKNSRLRKLSVQKIKLPHDPCGHVQRVALFVGADKTVYAAQCSVLSQSSDGGRTWTHLRQQTSGSTSPENIFTEMRVLADGTWIQSRTEQPGEIAFLKSHDQRGSWREVSRIGQELNTPDVRGSCCEVLRDGSLVVPVTAVYSDEDSEWTSGRQAATCAILQSRSARRAVGKHAPSSHFGFPEEGRRKFGFP